MALYSAPWLSLSRTSSPAQPFEPAPAFASARSRPALHEAGASRQHPIDYHGIRARYLPEVEFRTRSDHLKSHYAFRAVAMIHGGVTPDLLDEAAWWGGDDFWIFATYALVAYLRIAAARRNEALPELCRRLARQHGIELTATRI